MGNVQFAKLPDVGVPSKGVTSVGLVESTVLPEPVEEVTPVPPLATGKVPVTPVESGNPVALVITPEEGVPKAGVTNVGLVANTLAPVPVSSVKTAAKLALDGVAKNAATLVAKPLIPVLTGNPVQFVKVPLVGVPKTGVTNVGLVESTLLPEPVEVVTPVPPLATGSVPVTPVVSGKPVRLVAVPEAGVPKTGVTKVGLVDKTLFPEPVELVTPVPPLATGSVPVTPAVRESPVALVNTTDVGVPSTGVTSVGLVDKTLLPEPVEVVTPVPPLATGRVPVTPVVRGSPVVLVNTPDVGVPNSGVTSVGLVESTVLPVPVEVVTPVPPLATGSVPVTPVVKGRPVALVSVPDVGVPSMGVTSVGLVDRTLLPEPVEVVTPVPPLATPSTPVKLDTTLDVTLM
jgi:hypothetical protein